MTLLFLSLLFGIPPPAPAVVVVPGVSSLQVYTSLRTGAKVRFILRPGFTTDRQVTDSVALVLEFGATVFRNARVATKGAGSLSDTTTVALPAGVTTFKACAQLVRARTLTGPQKCATGTVTGPPIVAPPAPPAPAPAPLVRADSVRFYDLRIDQWAPDSFMAADVATMPSVAPGYVYLRWLVDGIEVSRADQVQRWTTSRFPRPAAGNVTVQACARVDGQLATTPEVCSPNVPFTVPPRTAPALSLTAIKILPESLTIEANASTPMCAVVILSTGNLVIRTADKGSTACADLVRASKYAALMHPPTAAEQAFADSMCLVWDATGGTYQPNGCDTLKPAPLPGTIGAVVVDSPNDSAAMRLTVVMPDGVRCDGHLSATVNLGFTVSPNPDTSTACRARFAAITADYTHPLLFRRTLSAEDGHQWAEVAYAPSAP